MHPKLHRLVTLMRMSVTARPTESTSMQDVRAGVGLLRLVPSFRSPVSAPPDETSVGGPTWDGPSVSGPSDPVNVRRLPRRRPDRRARLKPPTPPPSLRVPDARGGGDRAGSARGDSISREWPAIRRAGTRGRNAAGR